MKLLIYCSDFYPNQTGYSHAFQNLLAAVSGGGEFEIDVVTPIPLGKHEEFSLPGVRILRWIRISSFIGIRLPGLVFISQLLFSKKLVHLDRERDYDLIFFETIDETFLIATLPTSLFIKILVRIHAAWETEVVFFSNGWLERLKRLLITRIISKKLRYISATSKFYIDFIKKHFYSSNEIQIARREFFVINNCIPAPKNIIHAQQSGKISLLSLGRMDEIGVTQKGFTDLLFSLSRIPPNTLSRLSITIIGSGNQRNSLIQLAKSLNLDQIRFIERIDNSEVKELLSKTDVVILPSRFEGQSMFALEAISHGAAAIFSDVGGLRDLIDGNGFFAPPKDIDKLAQAILQAANLNNFELFEMRKRSQTISKMQFGLDNCRKQFVSSLNIIRTLRGI